eukprot:2273537-Prymnesium_polylepis.1
MRSRRAPPSRSCPCALSRPWASARPSHSPRRCCVCCAGAAAPREAAARLAPSQRSAAAGWTWLRRHARARTALTSSTLSRARARNAWRQRLDRRKGLFEHARSSAAVAPEWFLPESAVGTLCSGFAPARPANTEADFRRLSGLSFGSDFSTG